jgi:hypothetical protein
LLVRPLISLFVTRKPLFGGNVRFWPFPAFARPVEGWKRLVVTEVKCLEAPEPCTSAVGAPVSMTPSDAAMHRQPRVPDAHRPRPLLQASSCLWACCHTWTTCQPLSLLGCVGLLHTQLVGPGSPDVQRSAPATPLFCSVQQSDQLQQHIATRELH